MNRHPAKQALKAIVVEAAEICRQAGVELGKLATYHFLRVPGKVGTFLMGMEKMEYLDHNMKAYTEGLTAKEVDVYKKLIKT